MEYFLKIYSKIFTGINSPIVESPIARHNTNWLYAVFSLGDFTIISIVAMLNVTPKRHSIKIIIPLISDISIFCVAEEMLQAGRTPVEKTTALELSISVTNSSTFNEKKLPFFQD